MIGRVSSETDAAKILPEESQTQEEGSYAPAQSTQGARKRKAREVGEDDRGKKVRMSLGPPVDLGD